MTTKKRYFAVYYAGSTQRGRVSVDTENGSMFSALKVEEFLKKEHGGQFAVTGFNEFKTKEEFNIFFSIKKQT